MIEIFNYKAIDSILWELRSALGRLLLSKKPANTNNKKYLNLGCGTCRYDNWTNADFYDLINTFKNNRKAPDWMLDLRYPLNCPSNYWDGIYTEHTLEHLKPDEVQSLLLELYRTLKPNGTIRIIIPDLEKYVNFYAGRRVDKLFAQQWSEKAYAIWSLTQNWGHLSVWDYSSMRKALKLAGYKNIKKTSFKKGENKYLLKDNPDRKWESLYVEAKK